MTKAKYNVALKDILDVLLSALPGVSAGVVFGLPCYKVSAGVFATLCDDGVGIKLPAARVRELLDKPGFVPFQPFGRNRGKEFVQINHANLEDYRQDLALFQESMCYVTGDTKIPPPPQPDIEAEQHFQTIAAQLISENSSITTGKMMSSPGIQYQGKNFAFFYNDKMVFKLGREFQPESWGIQNYSLLSPFKTKPPLVDWFEITAADAHRWEELARYALTQISTPAHKKKAD
jgi:hypothetical protein